MSAPRSVCVHCGQPYGRRDIHHVTLRWEEGEPEPRYEGSLIVVRRGSVRKRLAYARDIDVWNGCWSGGYPPFCTLRCALDYARKAYRTRDRERA